MSETVRITSNGMRIRAIPATVQRYAPTQSLTAKLRVAAYARVSTDQEEQLTSYEAQVDYYTRYIKANPEWEFVEVYADEGISATNTKKRKNFNRMISDAMAGKIDRIVTKSVSRFARNTVDTLTTIRDLKEKGVGVFFEKENIDTLDSKGELLITIMGSLAQEESRSISENVTWGWRKRFSDGKVSMNYSHFLGYEKGSDGTPQIVEEEAKIVRQIYGMFLDGHTPSSIASYLTRNGIPTPGGKTKWRDSTIRSILRNEKYKGDALLQKSFIVDFLSKKQKINEGEVPQYYVENSHPAIVSSEVFELVQEEIERRSKREGNMSTASVFSNRIICGECGAIFGSKVWHSTDPYRKVIWRCNRKYAEKGKTCPSPHLSEEEIKSAFVEAINRIIERKQEIFDAYQEVITVICNTSALERNVERLNAEKEALYQKVAQMVKENATTALDQDEYNRQYEALIAQYDEVKAKLDRTKKVIAEKTSKKGMLEGFQRQLMSSDHLLEFDEGLFAGTVDTITVHKAEKRHKRVVFRFKDGTEITVTI